MEYQKKHRPTTLPEVVGQPNAVKIITNLLKSEDGLPHTIGLFGPSGCGKTTIARILRKELKCHRNEFTEINCADTRGIDMVRDIKRQIKYRPLKGGANMIWLLDECHQLTKEAQSAFLKILEDTPRHVYFFLATTHKSGLIPTVRNRCTPIELTKVKDSDLIGLVNEVLRNEKKDALSKEAMIALMNAAEGSPRSCLVYLESVVDLSPEEQVEYLIKADAKIDAIELCRALLAGKRWPEIQKILRGIQCDHESLRHMMMAYVNKVLLGKDHPRAFLIAEVFSEPFYNNPEVGLTKASYEVCKTKR